MGRLTLLILAAVLVSVWWVDGAGDWIMWTVAVIGALCSWLATLEIPRRDFKRIP